MLETSAVNKDPSRSGICVSQIHSKIRYIKGFRPSEARVQDGTGPSPIPAHRGKAALGDPVSSVEEPCGQAFNHAV